MALALAPPGPVTPGSVNGQFVAPPPWRRSSCRVTHRGCEVMLLPTTHIDNPCTVCKGSSAHFRYPHKFHTLIMRPEVSLQHFRRDQLYDIMIQCFESPFDSPTRIPDARTAVRVEFAGTRTEVAQAVHLNLRKLSAVSSITTQAA